MDRLEQRKALNGLKATLFSQGFEHVSSIIDDCGTGGLFFTNYTTNKHAVIRKSQIIYLD